MPSSRHGYTGTRCRRGGTGALACRCQRTSRGRGPAENGFPPGPWDRGVPVRHTSGPATGRRSVLSRRPGRWLLSGGPGEGAGPCRETGIAGKRHRTGRRKVPFTNLSDEAAPAPRPNPLCGALQAVEKPRTRGVAWAKPQEGISDGKRHADRRRPRTALPPGCRHRLLPAALVPPAPLPAGWRLPWPLAPDRCAIAVLAAAALHRRCRCAADGLVSRGFRHLGEDAGVAGCDAVRFDAGAGRARCGCRRCGASPCRCLRPL